MKRVKERTAHQRKKAQQWGDKSLEAEKEWNAAEGGHAEKMQKSLLHQWSSAAASKPAEGVYLEMCQCMRMMFCSITT